MGGELISGDKGGAWSGLILEIGRSGVRDVYGLLVDDPLGKVVQLWDYYSQANIFYGKSIDLRLVADQKTVSQSFAKILSELSFYSPQPLIRAMIHTVFHFSSIYHSESFWHTLASFEIRTIDYYQVLAFSSGSNGAKRAALALESIPETALPQIQAEKPLRKHRNKFK